jgi:hypothetical protein
LGVTAHARVEDRIRQAQDAASVVYLHECSRSTSGLELADAAVEWSPRDIGWSRTALGLDSVEGAGHLSAKPSPRPARRCGVATVGYGDQAALLTER